MKRPNRYAVAFLLGMLWAATASATSAGDEEAVYQALKQGNPFAILHLYVTAVDLGEYRRAEVIRLADRQQMSETVEFDHPWSDPADRQSPFRDVRDPLSPANLVAGMPSTGDAQYEPAADFLLTLAQGLHQASPRHPGADPVTQPRRALAMIERAIRIHRNAVVGTEWERDVSSYLANARAAKAWIRYCQLDGDYGSTRDAAAYLRGGSSVARSMLANRAAGGPRLAHSPCASEPFSLTFSPSQTASLFLKSERR